MSTTRRQFLDQLAVSSLALGAMPLALKAAPSAVTGPAISGSEQGGSFDDSWTKRVTGKVKAVFDVPEVENGWGPWRGTAWAKTHAATLGTSPRDLSSVIVLRHNGIIAAMQQSFWDKYGIGKAHKVGHPLTGAPTDKNPALMGVSDGLPERFGHNTLGEFQAAGGIVLACNLAFEFMIVGTVAAADKVPEAEAWTRARAMLVPGVILQPTGVYACLRAQEAGCMYIRAS